MRAADLAREVDMPQPTIHRIVTGKSTRPYKSSLKPIADYFSLSVDQLVGELPISNASTVTNIKQPQQIPVIPLEKTMAPTEVLPEEIDEFVIISPFANENSFAVELNDSSMEPQFTKHTILILDPDIEPTDRCFVLVKIHDHDLPVFRQMISDGEYQYLKPLNPDLNLFKMRILEQSDTILGVLTESRKRW